MSRVSTVNDRYLAAESVAQNGVNLFLVHDHCGARFSNAIHGIQRETSEEDAELWGDVLGAAKLLRWRAVFRPQPLEFNPSLAQLNESLLVEAERLRPMLGEAGHLRLDRLTTAAAELSSADPVLGTHLLTSLEEVGAEDSLVVADGKASRDEIAAWLTPQGFRVVTPGMLADLNISADVAYVVGPPRLSRSALVTAPPTPEVTFLMPSWFNDLALPKTVIADHAEGAIRLETHLHYLGNMEPSGLEPDTTEPEAIDEFVPQAMWGSAPDAKREPQVDEVRARKILVSGGYGMWLDEGDRIRTLDPSQPAGERVIYKDVSSVAAGTYLLSRIGQTDRDALYEQTLRTLGTRGQEIARTQEAWKHALTRRLHSNGRTVVESQLRRLGIQTADRAQAWTDRTLARPQSNESFKTLLEWLGIALEPTYTNAITFRQARSRAIVHIREQLEAVLSAADMENLRKEGHIVVEAEGFADIIAAKVLALSPELHIVQRRETRELFLDGGGKWLE